MRDFVIASKVRIMRNLSGFNFVNKLSSDEKAKVVDKVEEVLREHYTYNKVSLEKLSPLDKLYYIEDDFIGANSIKPRDGVYIFEIDSKLKVYVNYKDHITVEAWDDDLSLRDVYSRAVEVVNVLERELKVAFDETLGYLTSATKNVGTGLKSSITLHLPAIKFLNMDKTLTDISRLGYKFYTRRNPINKAIGGIYTMVNNKTIGETEADIITKMINIAREIILVEEENRDRLYRDSIIDLEDIYYRSIGVLENARVMEKDEALELLSNIALGSGLRNIDVRKIYELMLSTKESKIQIERGFLMDKKTRDIYRASLMRKRIKEEL